MLGAGAFHTKRVSITRIPVRVISVSIDSATLAWNTIHNVDEYEVQCAGNSVMTTDTSVTFTQLDAHKTYSAQIRGRSMGAAGPWTHVIFHTSPEPRMDIVGCGSGLYPDTRDVGNSDVQLLTCADCNLYSMESGTVCCGGANGPIRCGVNIGGLEFRLGIFNAGHIEDAPSLRLKLHGCVGPWKVTDGMLDNTILQVYVQRDDGTDTLWMDANRICIPRADRGDTHGSRRGKWSDDYKTRLVTFDGRILTGTVFARIGIPCDGRRLAGVSV